MHLKRVKPQDLEQIATWYNLHNQPNQVHMLSDIGFMVDGVAAAFLYTTNSKLCLFESFISNPKSSKDDRKKALDLISEELLKTAKELGFSAVLSLVDNKATEKRCIDYGFEEAEFKPYIKILTE